MGAMKTLLALCLTPMLLADEVPLRWVSRYGEEPTTYREYLKTTGILHLDDDEEEIKKDLIDLIIEKAKKEED